MVKSKLPWYIVPIYPALAVLLAHLFFEVAQAYQTHRRIIVVVCINLVIVAGLYSILFRGFMYNGFYLKSEAPKARLARLAASTSADDRDSLVLFSESKAIFRPTALFYSNRPVQQAYASDKPTVPGEDRYYYIYENLKDITRHSTKRIILRRKDIDELSADYEINVIAGVDELVYAIIKHKD
jgi:hypothetical protein